MNIQGWLGEACSAMEMIRNNSLQFESRIKKTEFRSQNSEDKRQK
jgi:hypothetical protein